MTLPEGEFEAPSLETWYKTGKILISYTSEVERNADGSITIKYQVNSTGESKSVEVYTPYMTVMELFSDERREEFIKLLPSRVASMAGPDVKWSEIGADPWVQRHTYYAQPFNPEILAIVDHPIGIKTEEGVDCIMVSAFGQFPFRFSFNDCPDSE